jgi:hypothetical protein
MPSPIINNAARAWTQGASWLDTYQDNLGTQYTEDFQNASGALLYPGDVVVLGTSTSIGAVTNDATGLSVGVTNTASDARVVGVVGGEPYNYSNPQPYTSIPVGQVGGGLIPSLDTNWVASNGYWNTGVTLISDPFASIVNVGKFIYGPGIPAGAYVVSAVANTSYTISTNTTAIGYANTSPGGLYYLGPQTSGIGPGFPWQTNVVTNATGPVAYANGSVVPVVTRGWAYINIGTATPAAGAQVATAAAYRTVAAPATAASVAALQALAGTFIAVTLEAQAAGLAVPDNAGGTSFRVVRAWIDKF